MIRSYCWFLFCFILIAAYQFFVPSLSSSPELWAEAGTNYFWHANHSGFWENIWTLDSGYLPWLPRLIAMSIHQLGISPPWVAACYQGSALVLIAAFCSAFCLPVFDVILPMRWMRMVISLGLAIRYEYALHTFINFSYYGGIPIFLTLLSYPLLPRMTWKVQISLALFFFVICASKALFLAFLPAAFIMMLILMVKKSWRANGIILTGILGGLLLQYLVMFHFSSPHVNRGITIGVWIWAILSHWTAAAFYTLSGRFLILNHESLWKAIYVVLISFGVFFAIWKRIRNKGEFWQTVWPLAATGLISGAGVAMTVFAFPQIFAHRFPEFPDATPFGTRWWIIPVNVLYLGLAIFVFRGFKKNLNPIFPVLAFIFWLPSSQFWHIETVPEEWHWPEVGYSNWAGHSLLLPKDSSFPYCVPLNPYPWLLAKDCTYLIDPPSWPLLSEPQKQVVAKSYPVPTAVTQGSLLMIGIPKSWAKGKIKESYLIAEDKNHKEIARAVKVKEGRGPVQFFAFSSPVSRVSKVRLQFLTDLDKEIPVSTNTIPKWIWLGQPTMERKG